MCEARFALSSIAKAMINATYGAPTGVCHRHVGTARVRHARRHSSAKRTASAGTVFRAMPKLRAAKKLRVG